MRVNLMSNKTLKRDSCSYKGIFSTPHTILLSLLIVVCFLSVFSRLPLFADGSYYFVEFILNNKPFLALPQNRYAVYLLQLPAVFIYKIFHCVHWSLLAFLYMYSFMPFLAVLIALILTKFRISLSLILAIFGSLLIPLPAQPFLTSEALILAQLLWLLWLKTFDRHYTTLGALFEIILGTFLALLHPASIGVFLLLALLSFFLFFIEEKSAAFLLRGSAFLMLGLLSWLVLIYFAHNDYDITVVNFYKNLEIKEVFYLLFSLYNLPIWLLMASVFTIIFSFSKKKPLKRFLLQSCSVIAIVIHVYLSIYRFDLSGIAYSDFGVAQSRIFSIIFEYIYIFLASLILILIKHKKLPSPARRHSMRPFYIMIILSYLTAMVAFNMKWQKNLTILISELERSDKRCTPKEVISEKLPLPLLHWSLPYLVETIKYSRKLPFVIESKECLAKDSHLRKELKKFRRIRFKKGNRSSLP